MHGVFFHFLKEYMQEKYGGKESWDSLLLANGYAYKVYFTIKEYPDEEFNALINMASRLLDIPSDHLIRDYGEFMVPHMLVFYATYLKDKSWRSLELIENVGTSIHHTVKRRNPDTRPPEMITERISRDQIVLRYRSERKLCVLLSGMIHGVGNHFGEHLEIREHDCMLNGASECRFEIWRRT